MSVGIAAFFCSVSWFASVFRELPERVRAAQHVLLAYCAGYLCTLLLGLVLGGLGRDPGPIYFVGPIVGAICGVAAGARGIWRIRSRRRLERVRALGDGAYRDAAAVPESAKPPRAAQLPPSPERATGRFLAGLFLLLCTACTAVLELTETRLCHWFPQLYSSRAIARSIAHSPYSFAPTLETAGTGCRDEDRAYCGRFDPTSHRETQVLADRGASAVSAIADVLGELPDDQFVQDCTHRLSCIYPVKSLMYLLDKQTDPGVVKALRRWFDKASAPRELRILAASRLVRSGYTQALPDLAELLCNAHESGYASPDGILELHLTPENVPQLEPVFSRPGATPCVVRTSVQALLALNSTSAWAAIERVAKNPERKRAVIVYEELERHYERSLPATLELLTRLAVDGPHPERACYALARVQELRLGRKEDALLIDFCRGNARTAQWRAKMKELAAQSG